MIRLKRLFAHDFKQLQDIDLVFPESGRILIQGKNEAGKSTLFEAVFFALFGQALPPLNLDDLIGYDKAKARVELDLTLDDRLFKIVRTLNRGRANVWRLTIIHGDKTEEIRGNRAVNDRLVSELGFDSEALLNTCFVEQKKLEKLEGLSRDKREVSLSKLLNLERLLDLEERFRLRGDDEKQLVRLQKRFELAVAQQELPTAQEQLERADKTLRLIELRDHVGRATEEQRVLQELAARAQALLAKRDRLRAAVSQIDGVDRARRAMATALDRVDLLARETASLERWQAEHDQLSRANSERIPALQSRARELARLGRQLVRLDLIAAAGEAAAKEADRLRLARLEAQSQQGRLQEIGAAIAQHELRARELDTRLRDYDIRETLRQWAAASSELLVAQNLDRLVGEKAGARDQAQAELRVAVLVPGVLLVALVSATFFIPLALLLMTGNTTIAFGAGGALLISDLVIGFSLIRWAIGVWARLQEATEELGQAEGEAAIRAQMIGSATERLNRAQLRLTELSSPVPANAEAAQAKIAGLTIVLGNQSRDQIARERDHVRGTANYAQAERDQLSHRIQGLLAQASDENVGFQQARHKHADAAVARWRPVLASHASALGVQPDNQSVRDSRQELERERRDLQARIQQAKQLTAQIQEGESRRHKISGEIQSAYEAGRTALDGSSAPWSPELPREAYVAMEEQLSALFEQHGGEGVRAQLTATERELSGCERETTMREQNARAATTQSLTLLRALGMSDELSSIPSLEELQDLDGRLSKLELGERADLQAQVNRLYQTVGGLRGTCERLERELGLGGETVDPVAARDELQTARRDQEERKHAAVIVERARKRIVQKVLPSTMDYLRRILPQLTRDRYHDAELDPESYKIKVWDERAGQSGAWKEKNIFSGGAKDQFSLALRLAFALATLPQERGASPGFIFLDEPLGSFDDERASALLYLLTEGEIGRAFDQIFLISHVRVDENRFTHQVRLENGAIVESTLEQAPVLVGTVAEDNGS